MKLKPDQERVKNLLSDTVALLCKNGLAFEKELKIQGLLGVTIDDNDVFIVHLNESYAGLLAAEEAETVSVTSKDSVAPEQKSKDSRNEGGAPKRPHPSPMRSHSQSPHTESKRPRPSSSHLQSPHRRASHSSSNDSVVVQVKQEKEDDIELVEAKSEPNFGGYYGAHSEMGGPHGKRRTEMFPAGNAQEPYITSVMRNPGGGEPGSSWDPNSSQPSTLAHDSQLDATSGSSQWNPGLGLPPGSEGVPRRGIRPAPTTGPQMRAPPRQQRPKPAANPGTVGDKGEKVYTCDVEGCHKVFRHSFILYRHQRDKHGMGYVRGPRLQFNSAPFGQGFPPLSMDQQLNLPPSLQHTLDRQHSSSTTTSPISSSPKVTTSSNTNTVPLPPLSAIIKRSPEWSSSNLENTSGLDPFPSAKNIDPFSSDKSTDFLSMTGGKGVDLFPSTSSQNNETRRDLLPAFSQAEAFAESALSVFDTSLDKV